MHSPCMTLKQVDETILYFTSFQMRSLKLTPKPTFYTPKKKGLRCKVSFWEVLNITFQKGLQYMMGWSTCVRYENNAWKKIQNSSPKWWWKMVIYQARIRKTSLEKTDLSWTNHSWSTNPSEVPPPPEWLFFHQEFQVPKMEVLNLIRLFWAWGFPYISLTYSLYRWVPPF